MPHLLNISETQHFQTPVKWISVLYSALMSVFVSLNVLIKPTEHFLMTSCPGNYRGAFV